MLTRTKNADALAEMVADDVRRAIVRGDLSPGDRIVERKLSDELQVSRTPVREALKLLRADGLVEISKNKGARVAAFTGKIALDLFAVIAALEGQAAGSIARSLTAQHLDALEAMHGAMLAHYRNRDLDPYFAANSAIHDYIVTHCGNAVVRESHGRLSLRARRGRYLAIMDAARWAEAVDEHQALMRVLRKGDAAAAQDVWTAHLRHTGDSVAKALDEADPACKAAREAG